MSDSTTAKTGRAAELEREGDIAADYLEGLLDIADLDGDIDMDVEGDRALVSIVGGDLDQLVGRAARSSTPSRSSPASPSPARPASAAASCSTSPATAPPAARR